MTDEYIGEPTETPDPAEVAEKEALGQYGLGPVTIREAVLVGVWLVAFIISFFSIVPTSGLASGGTSVWTAGLEWILTIGLPSVAVFLILLRRFSPEGIKRVGSIAVDQFASVAFSVSAMVWLTWLWRNVATAITAGVWPYSWVVWVEFFLMLAGVVFTVFAPFIPPFSEDFRGRSEVVAHRNASPVRAVVARPRVERPVAAAAPVAAAPFDGTTDAAADPLADDLVAPVGVEPIVPSDVVADEEPWSPPYARSSAAAADEAAAPTPAVNQAFWALAPEERDVHDERGIPIFRVGPTAWALVIEDRGAVYVIRHEDGRIGYLHDVSRITRG